MTQLPVQPAWRLADCPEQQRWLVDGLWSEEAVGIIGGEPKCCKSFLALDLAVAVAAGIPCLRRFAVSRPGRVLLYPAEDALHIRCDAGGRTDQGLRELQRRHAVAVAVVHHARKGAGTIRAGQALRGSSEFHAWGDSNLYLRRDSDDRIVLTVEHRAAAATPNVTLELAQRDDALALQPVQADPQPESRVEPISVDQRITAALAESGKPRPFAELRASCRVRTTTLYERLAAMTAAGLIVKSANGYCLAP